MATLLVPVDDDLHATLTTAEDIAIALVDDPDIDFDARRAADTAGRLAALTDPDRPRPVTVRYADGWEPVPLQHTNVDVEDLGGLLDIVAAGDLHDDLFDLLDGNQDQRERAVHQLAGLRRLLDVDHGPDQAVIAAIVDPAPLPDALQDLVDGQSPSGRPWTREIRLDADAQDAWTRALDRIVTATQPDPLTRDLLYRDALRPVDPALRSAASGNLPGPTSSHREHPGADVGS